ncbi:membrane protein insertion efficiency factor YidD [[Limnothrix rosea] IAM M-220]|uniref:membrane protein insertion efficiency factor YidD n=1 Tax=[Limnothrix rosea] IAM M-220 TaxID=454133 RepID=UPI0009660ACC|nr:membrane protein insertion efficiency factor YidD [[Limnothrix rosea] IAM M-220]OKH19343.1 hypothetical protein NIES208_02160 [[Limnothrix rosea] IAM M-220]
MRVLKRRGLVYRATEILLPITIIAKALHLNYLMGQVLNFAIWLYQKFLSPHKGFVCAYRKLYGDASCSEYFRRAIAHGGLADAIPLFQRRLFDCKQAKQQLLYSSLSYQMMANNKRRRKQRGLDFCDCGDLDFDGTPDCLEGCDCDFCDCDFCDCG